MTKKYYYGNILTRQKGDLLMQFYEKFINYLEKSHLTNEQYDEIFDLYSNLKKEDIQIIEDIIYNHKKDYEKYLLDYDIAKKMNIRLPIIKYIIKSKDFEGIKNEKQIKQIVDYWETQEKIIKNKKYKKMGKDSKQILFNYIKDKNNKNNLLKIFDKKQLEFFINRKKEEYSKSISFEDKIETKSTENESSASQFQSENKNIYFRGICQKINDYPASCSFYRPYDKH